MKPKTLAEAVKAEKLMVLTDKKRAQLESQLYHLLCQAEEVKQVLEDDRMNRLRLQWLKRGWMARD